MRLAVVLLLTACDGSALVAGRDVGEVVEGEIIEPPRCDASCFACELGVCDPIVGLAPGRDAACVVTASGTPICWGQPRAGQLGGGLDGYARLAPFRAPDLGPVVALALAEAASCGLSADGVVTCHGDDFYRMHPSPEPSGARALAVSPLGSACALVGDEARCWGLALDGTESDEVDITRDASPTTIVGLPRSAALDVQLGRYFGCGWADDRVACFGANGRGQLGLGEGVPGGPEARAVVLPAGVAAVAVGERHACAATREGLMCWGEREDGTTAWTPELVDADPAITALAAGRGFTCLVSGQARALRCRGALAAPALDGVVLLAARHELLLATSDDGRLHVVRVGQDVSAPEPYEGPAASCSDGTTWRAEGDDVPPCRACVAGTISPCPFGCVADHCRRVVALAAGELHTCALGDDGALICWGGATSAAPTSIDGPALVSIAAGGDTTCGLDGDGRPRCWGALATAPDVVARAIDVGEDRACAIVDDGVRCWDAVGERTIGGLPEGPLLHVAVGALGCAAGATKAACWASGGATPLALGNLGTIGGLAAGAATHFAWGTRAAASPYVWQAAAALAQLFGGWLNALVAVSVGGAHACALEGAGRVTCWGDDTHGQLGPAASATSATPVEVPIGPARAIAAGGRHSCALTRDGAVWCWGDNRAGQLGGGVAGSDWAPDPRRVVLP